MENTDEAGVEAQLAECLASFQEGLGLSPALPEAGCRTQDVGWEGQ